MLGTCPMSLVSLWQVNAESDVGLAIMRRTGSPVNGQFTTRVSLATSLKIRLASLSSAEAPIC